MRNKTDKTLAWSGAQKVGAAALLLLLAAVAIWNSWPASEPETSPQPASLGSTPQTDTNAPLAPVNSSASLPSVPESEFAKRQNTELGVGLNPESVGWPSEAFSDATLKQLKKLAKLCIDSETDLASLSKIVADDFSANPLRPGDLAVVLSDKTTKVSRSNSPTGEARLFDRAKLIAELRRLPGVNDDQQRIAFKNLDIQLANGKTRVRVSGFGVDTQTPTEWTAIWTCTWRTSDSESPRLQSIRVLEYEEVRSTLGGSFLADKTTSILSGADGYTEQLQFGMNTWVNRLERRLRVNRLGHNGIAVGDVNGDGRDDLYVCQPGGLPNRLYIQQPDGTVVDTSREANVDFLDDTTCALIVDLDNDGDQDLAMVSIAAAVILSNDGTGVFTPKAIVESCRNSFSLTAADIDQDRLLDLYVGRYWATDLSRGEHPLPIPYYDANNGGSNILLKNRGNWKFEDVTREVGLDVHNSRFTMAAAWEDLDSDGDPDLYVANDFGRNCWYRNDNGQFKDVAANAGVEDIASGMSVTFSDYDHDGQLDIYVSNMFSTAGQRTTTQTQYKKTFASNQLSKLQRLARGNTLFRNNGNQTFTDVSAKANVTMGRWAWGSLFADVNNDSWDDLLVCNGFLTSSDTGDL